MHNLEEAILLESDIKNSEIIKDKKANEKIRYKLFKESIFSFCNYEKITIVDCYFENVTLKSSTLLNICFDNCRFKHCKIQDSKISGSSFYECEITDCQIENTVIQMSNLNHLQIKNNSYVESTMLENKYENSKYVECVFDYCKIKDSLIYKTYYEKCDLFTTELKRNTVDINLFKTSSMSIGTILEIAKDMGIDLK